MINLLFATVGFFAQSTDLGYNGGQNVSIPPIPEQVARPRVCHSGTGNPASVPKREVFDREIVKKCMDRRKHCVEKATIPEHLMINCHQDFCDDWGFAKRWGGTLTHTLPKGLDACKDIFVEAGKESWRNVVSEFRDAHSGGIKGYLTKIARIVASHDYLAPPQDWHLKKQVKYKSDRKLLNRVLDKSEWARPFNNYSCTKPIVRVAQLCINVADVGVDTAMYGAEIAALRAGKKALAEFPGGRELVSLHNAYTLLSSNYERMLEAEQTGEIKGGAKDMTEFKQLLMKHLERTLSVRRQLQIQARRVVEQAKNEQK